jgi:hypothetical protein
MIMMFRVNIIKLMMYFVYSKLENTKFAKPILKFLIRKVKEINQQSMIFLAKTDDISVLNKAILYVKQNELTSWLQIVHVFESEEKIPPKLIENIRILDSLYPKMRIDFVGIQGTFSPEVINRISQHLSVPKNLIFISCPGGKFAHKLSDFGGVRIITSD